MTCEEDGRPKTLAEAFCLDTPILSMKFSLDKEDMIGES